jgi:hypothetical protein
MVVGNLACLILAAAVVSTAEAGLEVLGDFASAAPDPADGTVIEYWAGSGSNEAVVVIDFGTDSYAFGYRWDEGVKYGKDLMDAVSAAGSLDCTGTEGFLATISYGSYLDVGQAGWPGDWWSYFTSDDGKDWVMAPVGFAARELSPGTWDGWARQTTEAWPPAHVPSTPTPEPVTVALLGLGALFLRKGRR